MAHRERRQAGEQKNIVTNLMIEAGRSVLDFRLDPWGYGETES
jgi:hypothetical protein